jgi:transposase-like protein
MSQKRRFTAEKKVEILREYLENQVAISELADKYQLSPSQIYQWKKQLFEGALKAFTPNTRDNKASERQIRELKQQLQDRDSVISEIISENIALKKNSNGRA